MTPWGSGMRSVINLALAVLLVAGVAVADGPTNELLAAQARYRERLAAIAQSSSNALRNLPAQYLREMDAVRQAFQTRGDLSGVMAATSEKDRVGAALDLGALPRDLVPEDALVNAPAEVRAAQDRFRESVRQADSEQTRKERELSILYVQHLEQKEKDLTRAGRIGDALLLRQEREMIRAGIELAAPAAIAVPPGAPSPAPAPAGPAPAVLFKDEFQMSMCSPRWRNENRAWRATGGRYGADQAKPRDGPEGNPVTSLGYQAWTNYEVECDFVSPNEGGVLVRLQDPGNCYALVLRPHMRDVLWKVWKDGNLSYRTDLGRGELPFDPDTDLHLRIVARGSHLQAYVNGELLSVIDDDTFASGGIGLFVHIPSDTRQYFDNIVVRRLTTD